MPKLRNGSKGIRIRVLSIASPAFYHRATALHICNMCWYVIILYVGLVPTFSLFEFVIKYFYDAASIIVASENKYIVTSNVS